MAAEPAGLQESAVAKSYAVEVSERLVADLARNADAVAVAVAVVDMRHDMEWPSPVEDEVADPALNKAVGDDRTNFEKDNSSLSMRSI